MGLVRRYVRDGCTVFGTPIDFNFSVGTENVYSGRLFYIFAALGISALFRLIGPSGAKARLMKVNLITPIGKYVSVGGDFFLKYRG